MSTRVCHWGMGTKSQIKRYGTWMAICLSLLLVPGRAAAEKTFPATLATAFQMPCTPGCGLCHLDPNGGGKRNPWGDARGVLVFGKDAKGVAEAFQMLTVPDFDGDGVGDVTELKGGSNPGLPGVGSMCPPEYGCGARLAPPAEPPEPTFVTLTVAALLLMFRARRLPTRRHRAN